MCYRVKSQAVKQALAVLEKRVLMGNVGLIGTRRHETGDNFVTNTFKISYFSLNIIILKKQEEDWWNIRHDFE